MYVIHSFNKLKRNHQDFITNYRFSQICHMHISYHLIVVLQAMIMLNSGKNTDICNDIYVHNG